MLAKVLKDRSINFGGDRKRLLARNSMTGKYIYVVKLSDCDNIYMTTFKMSNGYLTRFYFSKHELQFANIKE